MENNDAARFLMNDTQSLAFQDQILHAQSDESEELPEVFSEFWQNWYDSSRQHCHNFPSLLRLLEKQLFQSSDELLIHDLSGPLYRALRFWQLQIERHSAISSDTAQKRGKPTNLNNETVRVSLKVLIETWELFLKSFIPRIDRYKSILIKAIAVPYSFSGLAIIQTIDRDALKRQSSVSPYSSINTQTHSRTNSQENGVEHSSTIDLLTAKFQKTVGLLTPAEKLLQNLTKNLQQSQYSTIYSPALFELCDIYSQMEQDKLFHSGIRRLLLQNPARWDFALVGSQFCNRLLQKLPLHIRSQFHSNDPVALNWAGLYALADGEYGQGSSLSRQQQKSYWAQILQLKKAISDQRLTTKQNEEHSLPSNFNETSPSAKSDRTKPTNGEFYSLRRAQLLIYYILILEHLNWIWSSENSNRVLEENSVLWQNVMIEIYSLSEDISQRCKNRFL
ncbi:hypothetical protein P0082_05140 [Candidatus Haliotispira prima]|uniref:Uncharacterized protein n=1 Tax=Candidatus Haliotispira prima TaxID=3034016 RepID=A0ABY8MLI4_9SPIO|nr:hypothetical protein P0082_05140 [Candidatus Haliotispira prima]